MIERILMQGFAEGTEAFREELLQRCLAVLNGGEASRILDESELEMLAAAGIEFPIPPYDSELD